MKLHQLRYLCQIVSSGYNVTAAAQALHTSQSGISRQVRLLEQELGVEILLRQGNKIIGLSEPGEEIVERSKRLLADALDLKNIGRAYESQGSGNLMVATPHLHARFALQTTISAFCLKYPKVHIKLSQLDPIDIIKMVSANDVDIGITSVDDSVGDNIVKLPAYSTNMYLFVPDKHPLLKLKRPQLRDIAKFPLIILDPRINSGRAVLRAFEKNGLTPNVVMSATNTDVVKTYVESGLGIAFLRRMPFQPKEVASIRVIPVDHIFPPSRTYILIRREKYLRSYMYDFIEMISPDWTPKKVKAEFAAR